MKAEDVIKQLQAVLPSVTDLFTNKSAIVSLDFASGTVTAVTAVAHGLSTGNFVNIIGATNPVTITSITRSGATASVVTAANHDLTLGRVDIKQGGKQVTLTGSNEAEFNGTFTLSGVQNRRTFTISVTDSGATTATGSPLLQDGSVLPGYNGRYLLTVISPTEFTYTTTQTLFPTAGGSAEAKSDARISGAVSLDRADDAYTAQATNDLWAFVTLGDVVASKNREINSDLTDIMTKRSGWNQRLMQPFVVYVFAPAIGDAAGREVRDKMEDVRLALFKSLLGVRFDTGLTANDQYATTFVGDGFSNYTTAYYTHEFNFEVAADVTFDDTVGYDFDVAFRDVDLGIVLDFGTQEDPATVTVNLDEVPL